MNARSVRLLALLPLTLALAACPMLGGGGNAGGDAPHLAVGDSVSGEITSSSRLNYNDGSRHQQYRVALKNGQAISLELDGALNGQLSVFDGQTLLASADARSEGEDDGSAGALSLAFRAPKDGTYLVAVNSAGAQAFGPFKLRTAVVTPYDGKPLGADSEALDWLVGDRQEYPLKVEKAGLYTIGMESGALDSYLRLTGRNVELENDDGGSSLDARIRTWLEPGEYVIAASAVNGRTGSFKLRVGFTEVEQGMATRDGAPLSVGQSVHGLIDSRGRRTFALDLDSPRQLQFDALSDTFDAMLRITGPGVEAEDDDGGNGTNARLSLRLGPGRYTVSVSSLGGQQGLFELEITDLGSDAAPAANSNRKDAAAEATAEAE